MRKLLQYLMPPEKWRMTVLILGGIFTGILLLVVHISKATSYLSDEPETCINCHVMYPQYASWSKSSHAQAALCVDCHVPQDNFFRKYYFKGSDGMRHSTWFTFRWEPQVIQIKHAGVGVVQENCIRCHQDMIEMTQLVEVTSKAAKEGNGKLCWDCHREVPHGTVKSLSAAPHAMVERLPTVVPSWLEWLLGSGNRSSKVLDLEVSKQE
ncbi:MAG: cytochrome c nitrite reductase small subunit [Bacteroidales bacterium]|jgi:cytochrome c nitrite reductase small subunit|nr:cytochrome c nitrite reductase small subunit [Bacteroidales bacterium]